VPKGIFVIALLVLAVMIAVKDGRLPRKVGLTASCLVARRAADGSQLVACRSGVLEGRPDLTPRSCTPAGQTGTYEYWRCPVGEQAAPAP
jgi:hypothetical protein